MTRVTLVATISCVTLFFALVGCGDGLDVDYTKLGLVPVSGTIKLGGQPVEGAVVFFENEDKTFSYATTDQNGNYSLKFNSEVDGIQPGIKTVRISTTASTGELVEESSSEETSMEDGMGDDTELDDKTGRPIKASKQNERFAASYNRSSQIKATVKAADNQIDFDLSKDGTTTGPTT